MRRQAYNPHDAPAPARTERAKPRPAQTIDQLRKATPWVWVYCKSCGRNVPTALAPFLIRWGADVSTDRLRQNAKCASCGGKGATLMLPSWKDMGIGLAPFPTDWPGR